MNDEERSRLDREYEAIFHPPWTHGESEYPDDDPREINCLNPVIIWKTS
jgi:hypothetical protein